MLLIESFTHRDRLAQILARWMVNRPDPGDVADLKRIVNFNIYMIRIWLPIAVRAILKRLHGGIPTPHVIRQKGELKDFLVDHLTYSTARIDELCAKYRRWPEDFYRSTPVHGTFYTLPGERGRVFAGSTRIKRFRRIAGKGSRRIVDFLLTRIRASADALADERARSLGIPHEQLITSPAQQVEEFLRAERRVVNALKRRTIQGELSQMHIPDVAGVKLILEGDLSGHLVDIIESALPCEVVEVERHRGAYSGTNLKVKYRWPRELIAASPPTKRYLDVMLWRGFDPVTLEREYREFVEKAEEEVSFEVILSSFEQLIESEIGRSMHEKHIVTLRAHPEYNSFLATNVRHLMAYAFGLCRSPKNDDIAQLPIKLWERYLPEAIDKILLDQYIPLEGYFDAVMELPELGGGENWAL